jgi:TonB family protein
MKRQRLTAGGDLDDMRYRPYDHPTRNSPQRIRTARQAVTHDNRRATPNPDNSRHLVSGVGDSERRARQRARVSAAGPKAERGPQAKRRGGTQAADNSGKLALRAGEVKLPRKVERMTKLPLEGDVAPRHRRPRVDKGIAASETRRKRQDVADDRNRRQASSARRPDLLDMARASGKGKAKGRARGSRAGRRGSPQGRRRGQTVWLNTRDRRYVGYFRRIHGKIQPLWKFPKALEIKMEQGDVLVEFTLRADGSLARLGVRRGSGYAAFDANAVRAVRKAAPFPPVPAGLGQPLTILAPFEFSNPLIR